MKIGFRIGTLLCSYKHNSMVAVFPNIAEEVSARTHNCKRVPPKMYKNQNVSSVKKFLSFPF